MILYMEKLCQHSEVIARRLTYDRHDRHHTTYDTKAHIVAAFQIVMGYYIAPPDYCFQGGVDNISTVLGHISYRGSCISESHDY